MFLLKFKILTAVLFSTVVFWVMTPCNFIEWLFRNIGIHLWNDKLSYLESWPVKMGPIRCPETSANNYHTTPCNYPEDRIFHQHRGGSLKSRLIIVFREKYITLSIIKSLKPLILLVKSNIIWDNIIIEFSLKPSSDPTSEPAATLIWVATWGWKPLLYIILEYPENS
jgi:hypothetical protein